MEEQLAAYRARKAKECGSTSSSAGLFGTGLFLRNRSGNTTRTPPDPVRPHGNASLLTKPDGSTEKKKDSSELQNSASDSDNTRLQENEDETQSNKPDMALDGLLPRLLPASYISQLVLKLILWLALFGLFVCIGFGIVFIVLSLFYVIFANMRGEGKKRAGEKSAYSVFNPDCERIHGTLTGEEIERGMLYGIGGAMR